ncbi:MAG: hypothetical protein WC655_16415 [Candidatus Hydrogenedentales bacterium]|jgi:hypothetical protein
MISRRSAAFFGVCVGLLAALCFSGCNLDGVTINYFESVGSDNVPDFPDGGDGGNDDGGNDDGGGNDGGGGDSTDNRFAGTWIASYGDDLPEGSGQRQYAARMTLQQSDAVITGTGQMHRFFNTGSAASDGTAFAVNITGSASQDDATLTFAAAAGKFLNPPQLTVRLTGNRLDGVFVERSANLVVDRYGHMTWRRVSGTDIDGPWVAAFHDDVVPAGAFPARDRTASMTLASADSAITGIAEYVEQQPGDIPETVTFTTAAGTLQNSQLKLTLTPADPADGVVDWFGFHLGNYFVGAYGQFNGTDLARFGHATWYQSPASPQPSSFQKTWVSSFRDTAATGSLKPADYLLVTNGLTDDGNTVTGSVSLLDESEVSPAFQSYTIQNGVVTGSKMTFDMVRSGFRFSWTLQLASSMLVGSYQQFNSVDQFLSRGVATWRSGSSSYTGLTGIWASSFFDTYTSSAEENRASQLAVVSITNISSEGAITGTGFLKLANESNRRQFVVSGTVATDPIRIDWSGGGLFGATSWHVRRVGSALCGTYTNFASDNQTIEFQGSATFVK